MFDIIKPQYQLSLEDITVALTLGFCIQGRAKVGMQ